MAIVKMKKLRVMALAGRKEALLSGLVRLGCVEISQLSQPEWAGPSWRREASALAEVRTELADARTALAAVKQYGGGKESMFHPRPAVTKETFLDPAVREEARGVALRVGASLRELKCLRSEESKLQAQRAALTPWSSLELPLERTGTAHVLYRLGVLPGATDVGTVRTALADLPAELLEVGADQQQRYCLLICRRAEEEQVQEALRPYNFSAVAFSDMTGTAAENADALDRALAENRRAQEAAEAAIAAEEPNKDALRMYLDQLNAEASKNAGAERLMTDGTVLFFEGWAPAEELEPVRTFLEGMDCAWEALDPTEEEIPAVPVKLKNNWFTRPLNMVTDMYSLPAYDGVDPNPLMAPFFILFYGMMLADMGYGALMVLVSWFIMRKARPNGPTMRHMIPLMGLCGVSTFIWGALTGGFFGDFLPQLAKLINPDTTFTALPALFSPVDDALAVLVGSLALGLVQIFTGMAVSMVRQIKRGEVMAALCNEGAWYLVFVLIAVGALTKAVKPVAIAIIVLLVLTQGYGKKGIKGKLLGIGGSLYNNITGYFSDILSYSRLMALMLAGAVIAQVFNTLGAITNFVPTFILIAAVGNALNFALNLLGCYVHDMRLQCLEYFNRFYSDGGKPFRPIGIETQYVDIVK